MTSPGRSIGARWPQDLRTWKRAPVMRTASARASSGVQMRSRSPTATKAGTRIAVIADLWEQLVEASIAYELAAFDATR